MPLGPQGRSAASALIPNAKAATTHRQVSFYEGPESWVHADCIALHCIALHCIALTLLASGCSTKPDQDPELSAILGDLASGSDSSLSSVQEHDFGTVLAQGQTLQHKFLLKNATKTPIRLVRGTALTPCCSAIGPLPESIPPQGVQEIPVTLKTGYQSEAKRVAFAIETDSEVKAVYRLALRATLLSDWEIDQWDGSDRSLFLGHSGKQRFRLIARRRVSDGGGIPESLSANGPVHATFKGRADEKVKADGLIEATREVEIDLPVATKAGMQRSEVVLRWTDGRTKILQLQWEVRPHLKVSPSILVLKPSANPIEQRVVMESDGKPFRVLSVRSPLLGQLAELPRESTPRHQLTLSLNPSRVNAAGVVDLIITTDHPDQQTVVMSIVITRNVGGSPP